MEFVVTFDIADQSFCKYSMSQWKQNLKDLRGKMAERGYDIDDYPNDEDVLEWQYGDELFWEKISLVKTHGYWHLKEEDEIYPGLLKKINT